MCASPGHRPPSPMTRRRPPSPESSPSPSPPRIVPLGRRRLWSPPPRKRTPPTTSPTPSRSNARSAIPKAAVDQRLRSVVKPAAQHLQLQSRSRLYEHRSQHDSRPPADKSSVDVAARANVLPQRKQTPTRLRSVLSPPSTPRFGRRPPPTQGCNRGSRSVASTLVAEARRKSQTRPPTENEIERVNSRPRRLAL